MKKYIILIPIIAGMVLSSCSRETLEPYIPGALIEETALTTSTDLNQLMNSAYALSYSRQEATSVSVFTDEVSIGFANGGQGRTTEYVFAMNSGQALPTSVWNESYFALARINRVIKNADLLNPIDANDAKAIANIKAQALTMRAWLHLRLMSYFSTDLKNDSAPAALLADRIFLPSENNNARATNGQFYALIHSDLNAAISLFNSNSIPFSPIAANVWFAKGLKARAFAYKGDYASAEPFANDVIANSGITLATKAQYRLMFFQDAQPATVEVLFKLKRTPIQNAQASNLHNGWCSLRPNSAGSPFYEVSRALHNKLNPTNLPAATLSTTVLDVRANTLIAPSSTVDANYQNSADFLTTDRLIINKHGGVTTGSATWAVTTANTNNNDFKIMRLSEMYMIRAEARAAANDLPGVASALTLVRNARFDAVQVQPVITSTQAAWAAILDERRLEFAFEGFRYIDIKRLGTLANKGIDRDPADYTSSTMNFPAANPSNLPLTSYKFTLPIPQDELNVNSIIQQNPGY